MCYLSLLFLMWSPKQRLGIDLLGLLIALQTAAMKYYYWISVRGSLRWFLLSNYQAGKTVGVFET